MKPIRSLFLIALLSVVVGASSLVAAGAPPRAKLLTPRAAVVSSGWRAVVEVRGTTKRPPLLRATLGRRLQSAAMRRIATRRWTASITFPAAGRWRLAVRLDSRSVPLGSVVVSEAPIDVQTAFKLALEPSGTLLVADGGGNRIVRVDPRTGATTVAAGGLPQPIAVTAGDGRIYAIASERLYRIDGGGQSELARFAEDGPTDVAIASGALYLARYGDHVDVFTDGTARVLARGFDRPHGITPAPDGSLLVADTYAGSVRRVSPGGAVTTLATGLSRPVDIALDLDGTLLVAEHESGELSRIAANGAVTVVTNRLAGPSGVVVAADGAIYVSDLDAAFSVGRVNRTTGAVTSVVR